MPGVKPLALTIGEPAGIAGEITLKAWAAARGDRAFPTFVALADPNWLAKQSRALGLNVPVETAPSVAAATAIFARAVPVLETPLAAPARLGRIVTANESAVVRSIDEAVRLARAGEVGAVVTNPIHKAALYDAGFKFPGHTEYLAALTAPATPVMMLAIQGLRVVPVTVHQSLRDAIGALTAGAIESAARITHAALIRDFGIEKPRLAVAALNPHAGESGAFGREEIDIIAPAVAALKADGVDATGPHPADTLFHAHARTRYDAAICMYHDQALIPLKTLDFAGGVNVTLGLPIVRTSPDHGTALDIAGQGKADPTSLIAALRLAADMARARAGA